MIYVWNLFLWRDLILIQVLSQVLLKTPTLHAVTAEVTELNNQKKKTKKDAVYLLAEDNH